MEPPPPKERERAQVVPPRARGATRGGICPCKAAGLVESSVARWEMTAPCLTVSYIIAFKRPAGGSAGAAQVIVLDIPCFYINKLIKPESSRLCARVNITNERLTSERVSERATSV